MSMNQMELEVYLPLCVRFLFPDLPEEGGLIPEPSSLDTKESSSTSNQLESPKPG